jgi:hypothetical protein
MKPFLTVGLALSLSTMAPGSVIHVVSKSWSIDYDLHTVTWTLTFDRVPDFYTFDAVNRQADTFTIDVMTNATSAVPAPGPYGDEPRRVFSDWRTRPGVDGKFDITTSRNTGSVVLDTIDFTLSAPPSTLSRRLSI